MSLRFEGVSLTNFGPYRKVDNVDLTTADDRPIVVVHGENTLGKTSIFRALRWCLYGSPEANKTAEQSARGLSEYLNRPAASDGDLDMQVDIKFSADGIPHHLTRTANFENLSAPRTSVDLRVGTTVIQAAAVEAEIARLLHPQISEFFLFDGELLREFYDRLNSDRERDLLKDSIESVLGIPALQMAGRDIAVLTTDVLQRQTKALKNKADKDKANLQLRELKSQQAGLDKDRKEVSKSLQKARIDLESIRDRMASISELKADAREMETLESQIKGSDADSDSLRADMARVLSLGWLSPASARLESALDRVVAKNDAANAKQTAILDARSRVDLLEKRVKGGTCPTCNQGLPPADAATVRMLEDSRRDLEVLREESGDGPDLPLERRIRALLDTTTIPAYQEKQAQLFRLQREQFDRQRRLATIKDRLRDNDAAQIRQLGRDQEALEQTIKTYEGRLRVIDGTQLKLQTDQNRLASALRRLGSDQPVLAAEAFFFEYVQELVAGTIDRYRESTRAEIERAASSMFMRLVRDPSGYDGVTIGHDYRVDLVGRRGPSMRTSEGGRQLIALSLIGALKRAAVQGGPVVLDSPLARLDLEHRANVLRQWVPDLGSQAILLVQSGELTEDEANRIMGDRIGQAYRIIRPNNDPEDATIVRTQ
ncbi:AAA family ATPase [Pseudonocardia sp. 73-21]|uniref:AAA family ATPase n=1 Tax=Pseudonocardia sp. 73-21 TaxID=1895809 RepID=UPI00262ED8AD|nr:AAA family ATPase [Pseudonocardia sp. 73-21]